MNIADSALRNDERAIFALRSLYEKNGYTRYKMSKFEEYELYSRNKDFLISDSIITFTDTSGKLMALKPDVTLSIVKNGKDSPDLIQKVYYDENVYRVSKGTKAFKEIMQVGLECVGDIDDYCLLEVLTLSCESLKSISDDSVLVFSHLDILSDILDGMDVKNHVRNGIVRCISEKNSHELSLICREAGVDGETVDVLTKLVALSGKPSQVLPKLKTLPLAESGKAALSQLEKLVSALIAGGLENMLRLDFSVVSDIKYYNGIAFKGYVSGVPTQVLSGGQYDKLMKKLHRSSRAVGFAVYLDELISLNSKGSGTDTDILLIYDKNADPVSLRKAAQDLSRDGSSVALLRSVPDGFRYGKLLKFCEGEVTEVE